MKEVRLFNSLSNKIEIFKPIEEGKINIYVCGPTVYDDAHVGNFRPPVFFDTVKRFLSYIGYKVTLVSNFTDVDDKIIKRCIELGISEKELTDGTIKNYRSVLSSLNVMPCDYYPRVSETMDEIINYIDKLVKSGHAYVSGNDVYFRINSIEKYGRLSNINIEQLEAGARIQENENKENPFDFTLWKKTDVGVNWDSPWGKGRPGWHTECVVMINDILGNKIDIHGGGFDLKFPHHENEIAQSEACCNSILADYWMHVGFLNFNNQKMSKSLGNVVYGKDAIKNLGGTLTRYILLSTYYRSPMNLSDEVIESSKIEMEKISNSLNALAKELQIRNIFDTSANPEISNFISCMCDDFNISNAMSEIFALIKSINVDLRNKKTENAKLLTYFASLTTMLEILGLKFDIIRLSEDDLSLIKKYNEAKDNKNYELSDNYRKLLIEKHLF